MQQRDEFELLGSRVAVIFGFLLLAFGVLLFGFWRYQIVEAPYYRQLADRNRIRDTRLVAPRGRIYDREYRVIADNRPAYNLYLVREDSPRSPESTIERLVSGMEVGADELEARLAAGVSRPLHQPILLRENLSPAEIAFVEARTYEMPELRLTFSPQRRYANGEVAAHLLGYVGEVTQEQLDGGGEFADRKPGDLVGKAGLERMYDHFLQGTDGVRRTIVNSFQREMGLIGEQAPVPGNDLVTSIDLDVQEVAEQALGDRAGAAVVIVPHTGEVLALVSRPAFDPTMFSQGIPQSDWDDLLSDPRNPLQNRAIQNRYAPGSIFKIFMTAAGLEEGVVGLNERLVCHGHVTLYGNEFDCWSGAGHGALTIHDALVHSCNVFFYLVGDRLGIDRISNNAIRMGLGRRTGIDLPGEDSGLIPTRQWKRDVQSAPWYPGETISVSIGQGAVGVTPLQLTWAVGGVAAGGDLVQPHLVDPGLLRANGFESGDLIREPYPLKGETVAAIQQALWGVVNDRGTGTRARVDGFDVAGKTGTAQVVAKDSQGTSEAFEDHAWFVGFAPADSPQIVVGVFVEHGGGGGAAAAPVAQQIFRAYFEKSLGIRTSGSGIDVAEARD